MTSARVPDLVRHRARELEDRTAHLDDERSLSFREWDEEADLVAGALADAGVQVGDRILLLIANSDSTAMATTTIALQRLGAIAVPASVRWSEREVAEFADYVDARWAIATDPARHATLAVDGCWTPSDLRKSGSPFAADLTLDPRGACDILPTSGTTGRAKGVVTRHDQLVQQLNGTVGPPSCVLHALPVSSYGGYHGYLLQPLRTGATVVTMGRFTPEGFLSLIETHRPETVMAVPAMLALLARTAALESRDLGSVTTIRTGTSPLAPPVARTISLSFPSANLLNLYGSTEAGMGSGWVLAVHGPGGRRLLESLNADRRIAIRDEHGDDVPAGVEGDVWLGVVSQRSYWNDPAATAATWRDNWVRTGDRGLMSGDGDLELLGRGTDMIIRGGYNIAPLEIENRLVEHESIDEAAVVGVPHAVLGEDTVAVVVTSSPTISAEEISGWLRAQVAEYKLPRRIVVTADPLPRNAMGKLDRRAVLRQVGRGE